MSRVHRQWPQGRRERWLPPLLLTILFVLFRLPPLLNPGFINSDGAIAGLQARQMIQGEWEWMHWARDYITSFDSAVAAPFFVIFGASPRVLMVVTLLGQLTGTWIAFAIVRRRLGPWRALVMVLPCVFMTMALNIYLFFDVRQWCLALVLLACWLIDGAAESGWPRARLALAMVAGFVATFVDLFAVQFVPGLILFGLLSALDGTWKWRPRWPQLLSVVGSVGVGFAVLQWLRLAAHVKTGRAHLSADLIAKNWPLLTEQCLPWLIGAKVYAMNAVGTIGRWSSPGWLAPLQGAGALVFAVGLVSGAGLFLVQRIPWRIRVLGAAGAGMAVSSLGGFLCSPTAEDIMGARLLAPVILTLPFTLAPLAFLAGSARRLALGLSPYLLTAAIGGWLSYGLFVDGPIPVRTERGAMSEDLAVGELLRARGIRYAAADYWIAYRLTFILGENPIVVPEASEDRYPRWRKEFDQARRVAYLVHPSSPSLTSATLEAQLTENKVTFEKLTVQGYTVLLVER